LPLGHLSLLVLLLLNQDGFKKMDGGGENRTKQEK
jgi:hypothetical protein